MQKQYLEVGKFVTTHGIMGEIKAYPYCDSADFLCEFDEFYLDDEGKSTVQVIDARIHKNMALLQLEGYETIEKSQKLINKMIYINRDDVDLPDGRYFIQDLLGLAVIDEETNEDYGIITDITNNGGTDMYEIKMPSGRVAYFPAVKEFLISTDLDTRVIKVKPIAGIFTDAD